MLEASDLPFDFDFIGDYNEEIAWVLEETLDLTGVYTVIDYGDFGSMTKLILHYDIATGLWEPGSGNIVSWIKMTPRGP